MKLKVGELVRYEDRVWRVAWVNYCRAYLVPAEKDTITLADGRTFRATGSGVNVSPTSELERVTP